MNIVEKSLFAFP